MLTALLKMIRTTTGVLVLAVGVAACTQEPVASHAPDAGGGQRTVDAAMLDDYHEPDKGFYESLRFEGALLVRPPATVRAAAKLSTVVVIARIRDVAPQRVIGGLQTVGIHIDVIEELSGKIRPELADRVVVEFPFGDPADAAERVDALRTALPKGEVIWFLHWQGDKRPVTKPDVTVNTDPADATLYGPLHMEAMFAQGPNAVVNPLWGHEAADRSLSGVRQDGERFRRLSQLADHIRAVQ